MLKIGVFASGGGTNLQSLIDAVEAGCIKGGHIEVVFSNKPGAYALKRAEKHNIKAFCIEPSGFKSAEEYDKKLASEMNRAGIGLVCLAGYMKILKKEFIDGFKGKIMNIHPALLPSFGGKGMYGLRVHEAVIERGCKVTGCTVHFVDYGTDTGPIIIQKAVEVKDNDTPETLQKRVLESEHRAYPEAVRLFASGKLDIQGRRVRVVEE